MSREGGKGFPYLLYRVIYRHEGLQPLPVEEVGELHVDRPHRACVLHDPVFVHVWCIVVTWGSGQRETHTETVSISRENITLLWE